MLDLVKKHGIKLASLTGVLIFIAAIWAVDDRYAKASDVQNFQQQQKQLGDKSDKILNLLKAQYLTRKTILELKKAGSGLTPEEQVELDSLKEILKGFDQ